MTPWEASEPRAALSFTASDDTPRDALAQLNFSSFTHLGRHHSFLRDVNVGAKTWDVRRATHRVGGPAGPELWKQPVGTLLAGKHGRRTSRMEVSAPILPFGALDGRPPPGGARRRRGGCAACVHHRR